MIKIGQKDNQIKETYWQVKSVQNQRKHPIDASSRDQECQMYMQPFVTCILHMP